MVKQTFEVKLPSGETTVIDGKAHAALPRCIRLAAARRNILLVGPAGSGKTFLGDQVTAALGLPFAHISCAAGMSEGQLTGRLLPVGDGGKFEYVPRSLSAVMTVVIVTTNEPTRLGQRFRNRCEECAFQGGSDRLKPWIAALGRRPWETGRQWAAARPGRYRPADAGRCRQHDGQLPTCRPAASAVAAVRLISRLLVVQSGREGDCVMGRPMRLDEPKKITLSLSAVCHEQLDELVAHYQAEPGRRTAMTRSEVVERAVAALHSETMTRKKKAKK